MTAFPLPTYPYPCTPPPSPPANEHQVSALQSYAACFRDGTLASHVQGSRHWVQDKGPTVESYIGFIESYQWVHRSPLAYACLHPPPACSVTHFSIHVLAFLVELCRMHTVHSRYPNDCLCLSRLTCCHAFPLFRDPFGVRGEWEGFVACVNAAQTVKFSTLVAEAEKVRVHQSACKQSLSLGGGCVGVGGGVWRLDMQGQVLGCSSLSIAVAFVTLCPTTESSQLQVQPLRVLSVSPTSIIPRSLSASTPRAS